MTPLLYAGVLEHTLDKVLTAFQAHINGLLGTATCKALSEDPALALQMALETAAAQAGDAATFFVSRNDESIDHFVASILQTRSGSEEAAEIKILQRLLQVTSQP